MLYRELCKFSFSLKFFMIASSYLDPDLHKSLRIKAAKIERSISEIVNEAVRYALIENSIADDVRRDFKIQHEMLEFINQHKVKSVVMADGIIGCPHEEGIDYSRGEKCPKCPFWWGRDRWRGETD